MSLIRRLSSVLLLSILFETIACDYEFSDVKVKFYTGGGFEVSIPEDPKVRLFAFHGQKNMLLEDREAGTWNADVTTATQNRFVFREPNTKFNLGDRLYYWLYVVYKGLGYDLLFQMKEVKSKITNIKCFLSNVAYSYSSQNSSLALKDCE